jgi:hypothetical protein
VTVSGQPRANAACAASGSVTLHNTGEAFALDVRLVGPADQWFRFGDNYLILPPGEERAVVVTGDPGAVRVSGWNVESDE